MKEYILLFRHTPIENFKPTPEQEIESVQKWQNWIGEIAAQVKFVSTQRFGFEGSIIHPNMESTPGLYKDSSTGEVVSGTMIVKSDSIEEASKIAQGCPILSFGGSVEVRDLIPMQS